MESDKNLDKKENKEEKEDQEDEIENYEILSPKHVKIDKEFKIIIIGDSGVGKTCIMNRATTGQFKDNVSATIGFEYSPFILKINDKVIKLAIWDTCGQEAYRSLIKSFFNGSSLAVIVYAVDNEKSFSSIPGWIRQCKILCEPDTKLVLIGNKNDIPDDK